MHIAAVFVVIFGFSVSRADLGVLRRSAPTPDYRERTNRLTTTSRGNARVAEQNLLAQSPSVYTTLGERKTPTPLLVTPTGSAPTINMNAIGGPAAEPQVVVSRTSVITYAVQAGDIVGTIANKFGVSQDSIAWANSKLEDNPDLLMIGDVLYIPPVDGVLYTVAKGDTLESIAKKYKATVEDIVAFPANGIKNAHILIEGQQLMVPGGEKPYVPKTVGTWSGVVPTGAAKGSGAFVWPAQGYLTQYFWYLHGALDIASWEGSPILAADGGYVAEAGRSPDAWGYGNYILIDHGNGLQTLYAHLSALYVRSGQSVERGQQIGAMGTTGRSTGTHLHFEIRQWGTQLNPLNYLP
jgi:murein DD-endopeptidase MepM/ murein hydrolase activator NlpD